MMNTLKKCRYRYDALDLLVGIEPAEAQALQRFYCREHLVTELQGTSSQRVFQHDKQLLALQSRRGDVFNSGLLATDRQRSVLRVTEPGGLVRQAYAPYGHRRVEHGPGSLLGFAGEALDPVTGHYLLGNGHRLFNTRLMRFNGPDSLSPFGRGGLNSYAYCLGDPVNFSDPTGNVSEANLIGMIFSGVVLLTTVITLFPAVPFLVGKNALGAGILRSGQSAKLKVGALSSGLAGPLAVVGAGAGLTRAVIQEVDPDSSAQSFLSWVSLMAGSTALLARGGSYWAARDPKTLPALKRFTENKHAASIARSTSPSSSAPENSQEFMLSALQQAATGIRRHSV
ncbi:RHS repeat-associated core domain-containing protein [Pseudomonas sp. MIL9]|nr:RHS repeat-associated core domain-containing protein [Pseudomonas sp. MIL9]RZO06193.1 RHS repeat-associated core domain-containing protein [Pseudomonas moorei]